MADLLICGGLESLSTTPRLLTRSATIPVNTLLDDPLLLSSPFSEGSIASYTSEEALRVGIDRMAQDEWTQRSHDLYFAAEDRGFFAFRSEEHTYELQSLMRLSYDVFCLKKKQ